MAWLLLLVDDGATHGYELCREFDERRLEVDPGVVYRTLRQLEGDGALRSQWVAPTAGPRRRCYELTAIGSRMLEDGARQLVATRAQHDDFLQAHTAQRARHAASPSRSNGQPATTWLAGRRENARRFP